MEEVSREMDRAFREALQKAHHFNYFIGEEKPLKDCPFCGATNANKSSYGVVVLNTAHRCWQVYCAGCGASTREEDEYVPAIAAWNDRPGSA